MPPRMPVAGSIDRILGTETASLAEIVELTSQISDGDLVETARLLSHFLCDDRQDKRCVRAAVMLGAVMHRIIFEKHGVPRHRDVRL
jgi:hypothetical protein